MLLGPQKEERREVSTLRGQAGREPKRRTKEPAAARV